MSSLQFIGGEANADDKDYYLAQVLSRSARALFTIGGEADVDDKAIDWHKSSLQFVGGGADADHKFIIWNKSFLDWQELSFLFIGGESDAGDKVTILAQILSIGKSFVYFLLVVEPMRMTKTIADGMSSPF
ncbi:hypothetical protein O0I10_013319 [Lichtheimia ornata]|uniref:Uncharacterized protein n=1 Tax=Lichtheimia ornata TaxID=688661 RepID=A0AAD7UPJ3_9FUNG|nr:uncharacterized protein O0I10_013319 [Lichtheimia ornata]KAJ8651219.1 hypothetical protein O0I10_013319 [Lichtheimia ornata]